MDVNYFGIKGVSETLRFGKGGPLLDTSDQEGFVAKSSDGLTLVTIQGATGTGPNDYVTYAQLQSHTGGGASGPVEWADIENLPQAFPSNISLVDGLQAALDAKAATAHAHSLATGEAAGFMAPAMVLKLADIQDGATANLPDDTLLSRDNHTGTQEISTVAGLQTALDGKAETGHSHGNASVTESGFMSAADKNKLNGIQVGATVNDTDANLKDRAYHTGVQEISTVAGLQAALDGKSAIAHGHDNATAAASGFMSSTDKIKLDGIATNATALSIGTSGTTAAAGNHTHGSATTTTSGFMSAADKSKLEGISSGATANDTDANLKNRANHTGMQEISTVTGLQTALDGKAEADHTHDASDIDSGTLHVDRLPNVPTSKLTGEIDASLLTGTIDPARIPLVMTDIARISVETIADLTIAQQANVNNGAIVTTSDGFRWQYISGVKTDEASYVKLADITPEWDVIANRPSVFPSEIGIVSGLQAALDGKAATAHTHSIATSSVAGFMSSVDKIKLDGVAPNATANDTDANLKDRANHTGVQPISTITGLQTILDNQITTNDRLSISADHTPSVATVGSAPQLYTSTLVGPPSNVAAIDVTGAASIVDDAVEGKVLRLDGIARHVSTHNWYPIGHNRKHRVTARVRVVTDHASNLNRTGVGFRFSNDASENSGSNNIYVTHAATDGWITIVHERTSEQMRAAAPTATHFRPNSYNGVITTGITASGAVVEIAYVRYDDVTEATSEAGGFMSATDKIKLSNIASGATVNLPDANLLNRQNHTGTQSIGTVSGLQAALDGKASSIHTHADYMPKDGSENFAGNVGITRGNAYTTFHISANAGQNKRVLFQTGGVNRWGLGSNSSAESGGNVGSNLEIYRYDDTGSQIDVPISINRETGRISVNTPFYQNIAVFSANQTDTLLLERGNTGNNFIVFKTSADTKRLGVVGANLIYQDAGGTNRTVYHSGNLNLSDKLDTNNPVATGYMRVPNIQLNDAPGTYRSLKFASNGSERWAFLMENTAESGTSAGGNLYIQRGNNAGSPSNVMLFNRSNGDVTVYTNLSVNGTLTTSTVNGGSSGVALTGSGGLTVSGSGGITASGSGGLTATNGNILIQRTTADASIVANSNAGRTQSLSFQTGGSARWMIFSDNAAEGGSNAGSNFNIRRYSDTGSNLGNALTIVRSTGAATFGSTVTAVDFTATSDERLKTNWRQAAEKGWTLRMSKELYGEFDWTNGEGSGIGTSAQILRKEVPTGVRENEEGQLSVSYGHVAYLGVMDLAEHVDELINEVSALKAEINSMKGEG